MDIDNLKMEKNEELKDVFKVEDEYPSLDSSGEKEERQLNQDQPLDDIMVEMSEDQMEDDVLFARQFNTPPNLNEFKHYCDIEQVESRKGRDAIKLLFEGFNYLNYSALVEDRFIKVGRDPKTDKITPVTVYTIEENAWCCEKSNGQHNSEQKLHGLGRKIYISWNGLCRVREGYWVNGKQ